MKTNTKPAIASIGWAVVENGNISVRSVSPTRRAAIINFVVTNRHVLILESATDEWIEWCWNECKGTAEVRKVRITIMDDA